MDRLQALAAAGAGGGGAPPSASGMEQRRGGMELRLDDSGLDLRMDDSLTDMQWLQRMDAGSEIPGFVNKQKRKRQQRTDKENQRPIKQLHDNNGCRKRLHYDTATTTSLRGGGGGGGSGNKPPLSYASLIALAISSSPQKMLTLSCIYNWIESTFPFYRSPESKAWKNSIRHNLSIRKSMFTKVHQYPHRRGNGSYWTLLADGEDELLRARPLFTTLHPPIIDPASIYSRSPLTHTVKSKGRYMPVLPTNPTNGKSAPYISKAPYISEAEGKVSVSSIDITNNIVANGNDDDDASVIITKSAEVTNGFDGGGSDGVSMPTKKRKRSVATVTPPHLIEHSYSKMLTFEPEVQMVEEELAPEDLVVVPHSIPGMEPGPAKTCDSNTSSKQSATPPPSRRHGDTVEFDSAQDHTHDSIADCSLSSLLGGSFLTPTKMAALSELSLDSISFSPLYNFVTPQRGGTPPSKQTTTTSSSSRRHSNTNSVTPNAKHHRGNHPAKESSMNDSKEEVANPLSLIPVPESDSEDSTPSHSHSNMGTGVPELDSGIFSPFPPTSLHFSTPLALQSVSPLVDLPHNVFNTPHSDDRLSSSLLPTVTDEATPTTRRCGSRQLFPFAN